MKKLIVITGAGSGFGKEIARTFSEIGHPLLLIGRNKEALDQLGLANTMTRSVDVGNQSAFNEAILAAESVYGDVDLLINNAGQMLLGDVGNQAWCWNSTSPADRYVFWPRPGSIGKRCARSRCLWRQARQAGRIGRGRRFISRTRKRMPVISGARTSPRLFRPVPCWRFR